MRYLSKTTRLNVLCITQVVTVAVGRPGPVVESHLGE